MDGSREMLRVIAELGYYGCGFFLILGLSVEDDDVFVVVGVVLSVLFELFDLF